MKNLKLLLVIRLIINLADSLFYIVSLWSVSTYYESELLTGVVVTLITLPDMLLIFFGPIIDRTSPRKIIWVSSIVQIITLTIIVLTFTEISPVIFMILVFISASASSITYLIEEVMIPQIIEKKKIVFANSMFAIADRVMDSIFNGVSGILLSVFTIIGLYQLNLLLFALPVIPLIFLKFKSANISHDKFSLKIYKEELLIGSKFISKQRVILALLLPLIFLNFFNSVNAVALPFYSQEFSEPSTMFGLISAVPGLGGLLGTLVVDKISNKMKSGHILGVFLILKGVFWSIGIIWQNMYLTLLLIFVSYIFSGIYNVIFSSLFQLLTPINLLGRVNTTLESVITLAMPLGGILGGVFVTFLGSVTTMLLFGGAAVLSGIFYLLHVRISGLPLVKEVTEETF